MVSISRNLLLNANGDGIGILQDSLSKIGFIIDSKEKTKKIFGKTTKKAVRKFQSENGLQITGIVDDKTADKIIKIIQAKGTQTQKNLVQSHSKNLIMVEAKSKAIRKVPKSLLESKVFFKSLDGSMNELKEDEAIYVNEKLNNYFHNELLLGLIGNKISINVSKLINSHIAKLDYTKYIDVTLLQALNEVLTEVENLDGSSLKEEISKIKESFSSIIAPSIAPAIFSSTVFPFSITTDQKIGVLLGLKIPLKDNHIFRDDLKNEKNRYYIGLVGLGSSLIDTLLEMNLDFYQFSHDLVSDLVESKKISEKQSLLLKNISSMTRLTGDNPKFVKFLASKKIRSLADFISLEQKDWEDLIVKQQIPLPSNVSSIRSYAENIKYNIERSYPTQILLTTVSDSNKISSAESHLTNSVNKLLKTNNKFIESGNIAVSNWSGIKKSEKAKIKDSIHQLISFSNLYKHLGIQDIINNKKMNIPKKKDAIKRAINNIKTFNINNPDLDLRFLNFFDKDEMQGLNWNGIAATDQPKMRKQMMAYQRVLTFTDRPSEEILLLTRGYDSAISIGRVTQDRFEKTCGLELGRARMVYFKAQHQQVRTVHNFEAIRDVTRGEFQNMRISNQNPKLINALRDIDGYDDLFGPQNYCECQECMSILSPAAYFVDLMRFIDENISKKVFLLEPPDISLSDHPLYLKNRRSDLWNMKISCENTHTLIPYLTITNEVLQTYLERVVSSIGGATGRNIFEILAENSKHTKVSFSLPFNLRFEEIQLYLVHFGISISDIYSIFSQNILEDERIWRSKLGLAEHQFRVIAYPDFDNVRFRYGDPPSFSSFPVLEFLNATGLTREQLDELVQIKFNKDLGNIIIEKIEDPDHLLYFKEDLKNLKKERLDFIHRFIQLQKRTKWSISQLDMILVGLDNVDIIKKAIIDSKTIIIISKLIHIQEALKLDIEELRCMIERLPVSASYPNSPSIEKDKKLFERIFDIQRLFDDPKDPNEFDFHHFSFNTKDEADTGVDPKMPLLLSGLGITEAELVLLFRLLKSRIEFNPDNGKCKLDRLKISLLYRHIRLARGLKFDSINDFVNAISVCFMKPPQSEPNFVIDSPNFVIDRIDHILKIIEFINWLGNSPFNVNELSLILFGQENSSIQFSTTRETIIAMVHEIQNSKEKEDKKIKELKDAISALFGISLKHLEKILLWIKTDIDSPEIQKILKKTTDSDISPIPPAGLDKLVEMIHEIERVLLIFSKLKFTEKTVVKITDNAMHFGIENLKNLKLENLQSFTTYHKILDSMIEDEQKRDSDQNIGELLQDYLENPDHKLTKGNIFFLSALWKNNSDTLDSISKSITFPNDSSPIDKVYYLWKLSEMCHTLGINGSLLVKIGHDADFKELSEARDIILGIFSSKYEDEKLRQEKIGPYEDIINKRKSDILSDYIIALKKELRFRNHNDIYSFFLLDSEMGSCARTSRLASAISSLQLYVHRCLVNLEQSDPVLSPTIPQVHVNPSNIPQKQWAWRKNYVLWRANREIFLYPENYLEPDLRDNKTPLFKEMEEDLLQQKITKESVERSYRIYLSQFAELARLVISGSYYHEGTYYFFGRNGQEPWEYYYREWIGKTIWTPWKKIDLTINSDRISAVNYRGRIYIFWTEDTKTTKTTFNNGTNTETTEYTKYLNYSYLDESGKWVPPQKPAVYTNSWPAGYEPYMFTSVFPAVSNNSIFMIPSFPGEISKIDLFKNTIRKFPVSDIMIDGKFIDGFPFIPVGMNLIKIDQNGQNPDPIYDEIILCIQPNDFDCFETEYDHSLSKLIYSKDRFQQLPNSTQVTNNLAKFDPEAVVVGYKVGDIVLKLADQQFLIRNNEDPDPDPLKFLRNHEQIINEINIRTRPDTNNSIINTSSLALYSEPLVTANSANNIITNLSSESKRTMIRIGTSLHDRLGNILFNDGLEQFLSLETQKILEVSVDSSAPDGIGMDIEFTNHAELAPPTDNLSHIDFEGASGEYYRELFFHIPFLIAHSLNANQKFREAKWWYERIFDPTSPVDRTTSDTETDRNWRYIEFRNLGIEKMKSIFTHSAILQYETNPFNPHAIARLRISAYQKTIVMKYIDNLLDWGDHLFAQDTTESINEALMLYVLASDILGERPVKVGSCDSAMDESKNLTYQTVEDNISDESDFLITLENWDYINQIRIHHIAENGNKDMLLKNRTRDFKNRLQVDYYERNNNILESSKVSVQKWTNLSLKNNNIAQASGIISDNILFFCIPHNEYLLKYWDRVQDRLFKIRNCMNISGVRRSLALFQPPLNPMLLVKARASGLALEDILPALTTLVPLYRFTYLIEKAKQFTQTVQNFGSALLSALEKKDTEQLILIRSVHERNILNLTKAIKNKQLEDSKAQVDALIESMNNVENRINHYSSLINTGLSEAELLQQISKNVTIPKFIPIAKYTKLTSLLFLVSQIGSPFAITFGGDQLGQSAKALLAWQEFAMKLAETISESAGLRANFERREQEWEFQKKLAEQEKKQIEKQKKAAELRVEIAEKEIEIHDKNIEQTNELDEFYKNKFTNLGLYNYLSTSMFRLYREAYNLAFDIAMKAEMAYQFEIEDSNDIHPHQFIALDNWQFDRSGLLAGERLLLQLQSLENAFIENNGRQNEITQSFSLALLNPQALLFFKEQANCNFIIPEIAFDLVYPGQYRRIIKSVRITMPCVTGPYTNIGIKLTLENSKIRYEPDTTADLHDSNKNPVKSISTSNAQNDTGMFEFSFRDERYLPFEGAGAVESQWKLELPSGLRSFDYNTISDIILHISYTSREGDEDFRKEVQTDIEKKLEKLPFRLISLKHDFPTAFHHLLNPDEGENQTTNFVLSQNYFPYFLANKVIDLKTTTIYLKPKGEKAVPTTNLSIQIDSTKFTVQEFKDWTKVNDDLLLKEKSKNFTGDPVTTWTMKVIKGKLNKEKLDDIIILMKYKIKQ